MTSARRSLGARGEELVAQWYEARGYEVVARNWRCREGELDIILRTAGTYVFCEVKTRTSTAFGSPLEAVTREKQMRLRRLAARWLEFEAPRPAREIRFDVASVLGPTDIEVVEAAF
ncbi:MAG: YraN family protein [Actinobacteria bacterium]|nr:YraN family protein [Actinomycetota bacterium]